MPPEEDSILVVKSLVVDRFVFCDMLLVSSSSSSWDRTVVLFHEYRSRVSRESCLLFRSALLFNNFLHSAISQKFLFFFFEILKLQNEMTYGRFSFVRSSFKIQNKDVYIYISQTNCCINHRSE
jgi:hypothetical protein